MATRDRFTETEHAAERPARALNTELLASATTWFAAAVAGMIVVFVGLAVDAYRHNHGAGEETLLSFGNPGHLIAGVGLVVTSISVLAGLAVASLRNVASAEHAIRRMVPVAGAWVVLAVVAFSSVTYIGASGVTVGHSDNHGTSASADQTHPEGTAAGDAGVAAALEDMGIDLDDPSQVEGALTQGSDGTNSGMHDHGKHPTFTALMTKSDSELLPQFPSGTVTADTLPELREQVEQVRQVALKYPTVEAAQAAGFFNTTSDVPYMGQHFINNKNLTDGVFDPSKPEGLLYSKVDGGPEKLVGVWFLLIPGIGPTTRADQPEGFVGDLDLWHAHLGLCLVGTSGASEGETAESCAAKSGRFTKDLRWMMHVWVASDVTENQDGFFAYLNGDLYAKQAAVKAAANGEQTGVTP
ncbi:MAG: hypothetical protein WEC75_00645 [Dehalococcoidia bacterium]